MDLLGKLLVAIETHNEKGIRDSFEAGIDPNMEYQDGPLVNTLINMYLRGPYFRNCMQAFVDYGLRFDDQLLLAILLDNAPSLEAQINASSSLLRKTYTLPCTFTPLLDASLLHLCAEYNHTRCAGILLKNGADVNARAGTDEYGFGGQTPIFHTVNQHNNACFDMMQLLIEHGADLSLTLKGLIWGKGYPWETFVPAVNPISYAMMGLLRQFQRTEAQIYKVIHHLMKAAYHLDYQAVNVPNNYLKN